MSDPPLGNQAASNDVPASAGRRGIALTAPIVWALLPWMNRIRGSRFRYRLLEGLAVTLAINECARLWLGRVVGAGVLFQARILSSTVFYSLGWGLIAGWVLLGGWFELPTRAVFAQLAVRRGFDQADAVRLETLAGFRWLSLWIAIPSIAVAIFAALRMSRPAQIWALGSDLLLSLLFVELAAAGMAAAIVAMRRLELRAARQLWIAGCLLPEVLHLILPGFPTLRSLASVMAEFILRAGALG